MFIKGLALTFSSFDLSIEGSVTASVGETIVLATNWTADQYADATELLLVMKADADSRLYQEKAIGATVYDNAIVILVESSDDPSAVAATVAHNTAVSGYESFTFSQDVSRLTYGGTIDEANAAKATAEKSLQIHEYESFLEASQDEIQAAFNWAKPLLAAPVAEEETPVQEEGPQG